MSCVVERGLGLQTRAFDLASLGSGCNSVTGLVCMIEIRDLWRIVIFGPRFRCTFGICVLENCA